MAHIKLYLDTRRQTKDGAHQLKLAISHKSLTRYVALDVALMPDQWDGQKIVRHKQHVRLNAYVQRRLAEARMAVLECRDADIKAIHAHVRKALGSVVDDEPEAEVPEKDLLLPVFERWMAMKKGKTHDSYRQTLSRLRAFRPDLESVRLGEINKTWLMEFDAFMSVSAPSANARAVYMRNLRAVFNFAIDEGLTENYPFRRFHIKTVRTEKRSMSVEDLRELLTMEVEEWQQEYRDMFALSFLLMGINFADLLRLPPMADKGGRIVFNRSKTKHLYSMRVEPEAQAIIDRWRGESAMLAPMDRYANHEDYLRRTNKALNAIGETEVLKHGKKVCTPRFPGITTYWARHSWATIAASLDIPKDTIAAALGHGGNTVTDIYIDFDRKKVDDANRRVIDWVLYGKK